MSKTIEEIGLIVGGIALAATGFLAAEGIIALSCSVTMMNAMVGIGLSTALTGVGIALRPSLKPVGTSGAISFNSGPSPRRVIYGQFQTAGVLTYADFTPANNQATTNQYLHLVYTLTGHEISSFDAVIVDGTVRNFANDLYYNPGGIGGDLWHIKPGLSGTASDLYWEHMFFEFDFGRDSASPPFLSVGDNLTWSSACLQRRCAKVHVVLRYDTSWAGVFQSGQIPNIQFLVTGKKLIDPRIVTAWQPSTGYVQYQWFVDARGIVWVQTNASGTSNIAASRPNFEGASSFPATLADNTLSWTTYGQGFGSIEACGDSNPQGHVVNERLVNDAWQPGAGWAVGSIIEAPLGYLQQSTAMGTAGATEPAFSLTLGGATTDGTQSWVCLGRSRHAINPSNSALVVNDYLQDTDYGMGAAASTIDMSSVIAAANVCEEQVPIIWNSDNTVVNEYLYTCNGMFDHSSVRGNVLDSLCGSMAGWVIPPGDLWYVFAGSYQTPTIALGDSDMRGPIKGDFRISKRDLLNTVGAQFVPAFLPSNPAGALSLTQVPATWQAMSAPEYQANGLAGKPNYLNSEDGGQILRIKLQLDFTTSLWTAQRLEKIALMRSRFQQTLTLPCKIIALQIEAGNAFSFTHLRWGILSQTFEATQVSVTFDGSSGAGQGNAPALGADIIARQTDPSIYEFQGPTSASNFGEYSPYGVTGVMTGVE